jgi:hypothetical protein
MADTEVQAGEKSQKRGEGRSPAYPFIPVQKALERVQELYAQESAHPAPLKSAMAAWSYSTKSSGGRQTLATMRYYGLIEVTGEGDERMVKVSELARKIILDKREDDTEKRALIRQVALMPSAHKALFQEYPDGLPSDGTVHHFLVFKKQYNDAAASELLTEFKQTASYVGLYEPHNSVDNDGEKDDNSDAKLDPNFKVGDRVQVTVAGQDMFADGATILGFSDDGAYVFTDQADSGAKIEEVTLLEAAPAAPAVDRPTVPAHFLAAKKQAEVLPPGSRKAIFPIDEGDVALIFPENISEDGLETLGLYLDIFLKKEIQKKH